MRGTAWIATVVAVLGTLIVAISVPAEARHLFDWNGGQGFGNNFFGSNSSGSGIGSGSSGGVLRLFHLGGNQNSGSNFGLGNFFGSGSNGGRRHFWNIFGGSNSGNSNGLSNGFGFGSDNNVLLAGDVRVANKIRRVQKRLNSGNLSSAERSTLQSRLSSLQAEQANLHGLLNNDITGRESRIQSLLSSGNLSSGSRNAWTNSPAR